VTDGVASLVDLAPTLLIRAGVAVPDHMQGRSLTEEDPGRTAFFRTVRGIGRRGVDRTVSPDPATVFDNADDPFQYDNLADTLTDDVPCDPLLADLHERDREIPWRNLEDDPR